MHKLTLANTKSAPTATISIGRVQMQRTLQPAHAKESRMFLSMVSSREGGGSLGSDASVGCVVTAASGSPLAVIVCRAMAASLKYQHGGGREKS